VGGGGVGVGREGAGGVGVGEATEGGAGGVTVPLTFVCAVIYKNN
jgi:hypothetical protein